MKLKPFIATYVPDQPQIAVDTQAVSKPERPTTGAQI
jgi:hypothetical protein